MMSLGVYASELNKPDLHLDLPPQPIIKPMAAPIIEESFDIQESNELERMSHVAMTLYFKSTRAGVVRQIEPKVRRKLEEAHDSPAREHREGINALRHLMSGIGDTNDQRALRFIHDLVTDATQDVLQSHQDQLDKAKKELEDRVPKKKAGLIAGGASLITGALAAAVTLILHFTNGNC